MPIYKWIALDSKNNIKSGITSADSELKLKDILLDLNLKLLESYINTPSGFNRIPFNIKSQFFYNLYTLLESGVLLPQALEIIVPNINNKKFKEIISDISNSVSQGKSLSECLKSYRPVFSDFMIQIISSGENSGNLAKSLKQLSAYLELKGSFYKKIRASLLMPLITLCFFVFISLIIFIYIVPSFSSLLSQTNSSLPNITKNLLKVSLYFQKLGIIKISLLLLSFLLALTFFFRSNFGNKIKNKIITITPFFNKIYLNSLLTVFLRSVALMLDSGIHLNKALKDFSNILDNTSLKNQFQQLSNKVESGISLSDSMKNYKIFSNDLVATMHVAQESGNLVQAMNLASEIYYQKVIKQLNLITSLIQPILIIFMGILIALLIASVYLPIVQMPSNIDFA